MSTALATASGNDQPMEGRFNGDPYCAPPQLAIRIRDQHRPVAELREGVAHFKVIEDSIVG